MYNKSTLIAALIIVLLLAIEVGAQTSSSGSNYSSISAFTEPYRSIEVAASEMGTLVAVEVKEGDRVRKGDILAKLDEKVLSAAKEIAQCSLESKGRLKSATAELKMQEGRLLKLQGLFQRNHASQVELDRAQTQAEVARAQVESVRDELDLKSFEMKRIEAQLEQRRLRSPIDGIVTRVLKDEGEFVSANDPIVAQVIQLNPLLAVFSVPQQKALKISSGQEVELVIDQFAENAKGLIEFVSPNADAQSGTCRVKVKIDNSNFTWPSGVSCKMILDNESPSTARKLKAKGELAARK